MAISYFRKKIKVNINGETVDKYVASIRRGEPISIEEVAEYTKTNSTVSPGDLVNSIHQLLEAVIAFLTKGHTVRLDPLGTLYPSINAKACDTPEEVTSNTITRFYAIFKPSVKLNNIFKGVQFHLGDNIVIEVKYKKNKPENKKVNKEVSK